MIMCGFVGLRVVTVGLGISIWSGFAMRMGSIGISSFVRLLEVLGLEEKRLLQA